jgi:hypothetical protein
MLLTDVLEQEEGRMEGQEEKVREKAYLLCKEYLQVCIFRPGKLGPYLLCKEYLQVCTFRPGKLGPLLHISVMR